MGDMRTSNYALWPWPLMLDQGERVKVILRVPNGRLVLYGTVEEAPHAVDGERNKLRFKLDTLKPHVFSYEPDRGDKVTLAASPRDESILPGVAMTGWFVADAEYENIWGLHFDDKAAVEARHNSLRETWSDVGDVPPEGEKWLSERVLMPARGATEEPGT